MTTTDPGERRALALLRSALGARPLPPGTAAHAGGCPGCGCLTEPSASGHRSYCLACTVAELPGDELDNALRIEFRLSWPAYLKRKAQYGSVWTDPGEWITPQNRR